MLQVRFNPLINGLSYLKVCYHTFLWEWDTMIITCYVTSLFLKIRKQLIICWHYIGYDLAFELKDIASNWPFVNWFRNLCQTGNAGNQNLTFVLTAMYLQYVWSLNWAPRYLLAELQINFGCWWMNGVIWVWWLHYVVLIGHNMIVRFKRLFITSM
jgi:hypothetical protein